MGYLTILLLLLSLAVTSFAANAATDDLTIHGGDATMYESDLTDTSVDFSYSIQGSCTAPDYWVYYIDGSYYRSSGQPWVFLPTNTSVGSHTLLVFANDLDSTNPACQDWLGVNVTVLQDPPPPPPPNCGKFPGQCQ